MSKPATYMHEHASDLDLIKQFAATNDRQAFEMLARRHEQGLLGLAAGMLGNPDDLAIEAVQNTWIRVMKYAGSFRGSSSVKTWLYRILINQCRTLQKKAIAQKKRETAASSVKATSAGIESDREFQQRVNDAVSQLPGAHREVVLLCYHAEMSHALAAEILQIPVGTLKSRLNASLTKLRQALGAEVQA